MYTTHPLLVIDPCAKYGRPMSKQKKSYGPDTKTCQKPYKFDLEVRIWIMNVRDTSSHGDNTHVPTLVSQCQTIKKLWAGHESAQTDGQLQHLTLNQNVYRYPLVMLGKGSGIDGELNGGSVPSEEAYPCHEPVYSRT